jgi:transposase InsO family protein
VASEDGLRLPPLDDGDAVPVQRRRFRSTTMSEHDQTVAPNRIAQDFQSTEPNQKRVGDTTEIITSEGRIYLAAIVDLLSRFVVGWALSASNSGTSP